MSNEGLALEANGDQKKSDNDISDEANDEVGDLLITDKEDQGGYWQGTDRPQIERSLRLVSARRQSIVEIQQLHGKELTQMRERFPDASSHELVRFLKARDYHVDKAAAMYETHLQWRKDTLPIDFATVQETLDTRKIYVLEQSDATGHPVIVYCLRRFKELGYETEKEISALVYLLEEQARPKYGPSLDAHQMTVLVDVSGVTTPPVGFLKQVNKVLEPNYPESLYRTIIFPVPSWLQRIIQRALTFLAKETQEKLFYVNDIKSLEQFAGLSLEDMGPDVQELAEQNKLRDKKK